MLVGIKADSVPRLRWQSVASFRSESGCFVAEVRFYSSGGSRVQFVIICGAEWEARVGSQCLIKEYSGQNCPNGIKFLISGLLSLSAEP